MNQRSRMNLIKQYASDFFYLFSPELCAACSEPLRHGENILCTMCEVTLPQTHFHEQTDNPLERHFWGRMQLARAAALYFFKKGSRVQHLLHQLKYNGRKEVGFRIGQWYGYKLREREEFTSIDLVVPVPLHPKKQAKRGYNQSDFFAEGISSVLKAEWNPRMVRRTKATETQTRKSRTDRWLNVNEIFEPLNPKVVEGKHVLLVDDVVTTGATLEACGQSLIDSGAKLSVATIACALSS